MMSSWSDEDLLRIAMQPGQSSGPYPTYAALNRGTQKRMVQDELDQSGGVLGLVARGATMPGPIGSVDFSRRQPPGDWVFGNDVGGVEQAQQSAVAAKRGFILDLMRQDLNERQFAENKRRALAADEADRVFRLNAKQATLAESAANRASRENSDADKLNLGYDQLDAKLTKDERESVLSEKMMAANDVAVTNTGMAAAAALAQLRRNEAGEKELQAAMADRLRKNQRASMLMVSNGGARWDKDNQLVALSDASRKTVAAINQDLLQTVDDIEFQNQRLKNIEMNLKQARDGFGKSGFIETPHGVMHTESGRLFTPAGERVKVNSIAQANKLPKGTVFIDPTGKLRKR